MDRYDFHRDFIKYNKERLVKLYNSLHVTYNDRYEAFNRINEYKPLLEYLGVNYEAIKRMTEDDSYKKRVLYPKVTDKLPSEIIKDIYTIISINSNRLPAIQKEIKIVSILIDIPREAYFKLQYSFNREIANSIIRGGVYSFGSNLSKLCINFIKRTADSKPIVDWGESIKLKNRLIQQGITPKTKNNPNGVNWLLYYTNDGYCFWKWNKRKCVVHNKKLYKFRAIATNNESTDYDGKFTVDEILEKRIGTFDRMMAIIKAIPSIKEKYHFNFLNY